MHRRLCKTVQCCRLKRGKASKLSSVSERSEPLKAKIMLRKSPSDSCNVLHAKHVWFCLPLLLFIDICSRCKSPVHCLFVKTFWNRKWKPERFFKKLGALRNFEQLFHLFRSTFLFKTHMRERRDLCVCVFGIFFNGTLTIFELNVSFSSGLQVVLLIADGSLFSLS